MCHAYGLLKVSIPNDSSSIDGSPGCNFCAAGGLIGKELPAKRDEAAD